MGRPTASILITSLLLSTPALAQEILYDNGPWNFVGGYSILADPRRSLLDDMELPAGGATTDSWATQMIWNTLQGTGHATQVELTFYGDANGAPDFADQLGQVITTDITETLEGGQAFGRDIVIMSANYPGLSLPDGRIWIDEFYIGLENSFILTADINFSPCWVDYADLGGRQPGINIFDVDSDVMFTLFGTVGGGGLNGTFDCPIVGGVATLRLRGGTASGPVGVVAGFSNPGFAIPIGPCAGTVIATTPPYFGGTPILSRFDANGDLALNANVPPGLCADIFVSAIDLTTCDVVNRPP